MRLVVSSQSDFAETFGIRVEECRESRQLPAESTNAICWGGETALNDRDYDTW
jgi:hypothetical protein